MRKVFIVKHKIAADLLKKRKKQKNSQKNIEIFQQQVISFPKDLFIQNIDKFIKGFFLTEEVLTCSFDA